MIDAIPEIAIGPTDATAEHVAAHVGVGQILGGEAGANYSFKNSPFLGIARDSLRDPENASVNTFAELAKMKGKTLKSVEQASAHVFGKGEPLELPKAADKKFHPLYDAVNQLSETPDLLVGHVANQIAPIAEYMPETSVGLSQVAGNVMGILQGHRPNLMAASPLDQEKKPTPTDISRFNTVANLLDQPLSILPKIKDGSATEREIGLVDQVYPNLMNDIRASVMKNLVNHQAKDGEPLDKGTRLGLSRLFGQPMDSSLKFLAQNQIALAGIGMANKAKEAQQMQPSKSGMEQMKIGQRDKTQAQQSLERPRK